MTTGPYVRGPDDTGISQLWSPLPPAGLVSWVEFTICREGKSSPGACSTPVGLAQAPGPSEGLGPKDPEVKPGGHCLCWSCLWKEALQTQTSQRVSLLETWKQPFYDIFQGRGRGTGRGLGQ